MGALAAGVVAGRMFRATADGAAAASLAESGGTGATSGTTYGAAPTDPTYSTGVGTGPMGTASGAAPLAGQSMPSGFDSTSSGLPGARTQDTP